MGKNGEGDPHPSGTTTHPHDPPKEPHREPQEDPTLSFDPFNPTGAATATPPTVPGTVHDPAAAPLVDDPVAAVLGGVAKASETPDSFRVIPESVKAILEEPMPLPDFTGLDAQKAAAAKAQWVTREKLRASGLALDSLAPVDTTEIISPGMLSKDERSDAAAQANSSSLSDFWRYSVENTAYARQIQDAEPDELGAIRAVASLDSDLDAWTRLRARSRDADEIATGADDIRKKVAALDAMFGDPSKSQAWMYGPMAILKGFSRELARQMAENLQGRSFAVVPKVDGVAFTLRQATSRYQGAFSVASDVQKAASALAGGTYASSSWAGHVGSGTAAVIKAIGDIAHAHKDPSEQPSGTPSLGEAIANLAAGADALSNALMAGRTQILQQSPTGPRPIELEQIASLGVYLLTACQSTINAEPLARGKFDAILSRIRRSISPELPVTGDLSAHWSQSLQQLFVVLKGADRQVHDSVTAKLSKLPLEEALSEWSAQAKGMPKTADKLYAAAWNVATLVAKSRAAIKTDVSTGYRLDAMRALDDIALTVSTQMIQYGALFPSQFK